MPPIRREEPPYRTSRDVIKKHIEDTNRSNGANSKAPEAFYPLVVDRDVKLGLEISHMLQRTYDGLKNGQWPTLAPQGEGGTYFLSDSSGNFISVFKPRDEEPKAKNNPRPKRETFSISTSNGQGMKKGITVGGGAAREIAAYYIDHPIVSGREGLTGGEVIGFSGVPSTLLAHCLHKRFKYSLGYKYAMENYKMGSLQMYMKNKGSCEGWNSSIFPVKEVHKISLLDIRLANVDRHDGNILVDIDEDGSFVLIPIDHGYCFPTTFDGGCRFEWLEWEQAKKPYSTQVIGYIDSLDADQDIALLKRHKFIFSEKASRVLRISTMLLKKGVKKGLTAFDIGSIMCRETYDKDAKKSVIEEIVNEAMDSRLPGMSEEDILEIVSQIMDSRLDKLAK